MTNQIGPVLFRISLSLFNTRQRKTGRDKVRPLGRHDENEAVGGERIDSNATHSLPCMPSSFRTQGLPSPFIDRIMESQIKFIVDWIYNESTKPALMDTNSSMAYCP